MGGTRCVGGGRNDGVFMIHALLMVGLAAAEESSRWASSGEIRLAGEQLSDFALDQQGTAHGQNMWLSSRAIAGVSVLLGDSIRAALELEAFNSLVLGDVTDVGTGIGEGTFLVARDGRRDVFRVLPRTANVSGGGAWGGWSVGASSFAWGEGILAHDGRAQGAFGIPMRGNVVGRTGLVLAPFSRRDSALKGLQTLTAADVVIRDESADVYAGDLAIQGVMGLRWTLPRAEVGLLGLARWQQDRPDDVHPSGERVQSVVWPVDVYGRVLLTKPEQSMSVALRGEVASIRGRTERLWNAETGSDGGRVASLGAVAAMDVGMAGLGLDLALEAGYASGDNDGGDAVSRTFAFHSDRQVGLVLFEHALPLITGHAVDRAADPDLVGVAPYGLRYTVAQGGVTNARYLNPVLTWTATEQVKLHVGWLLAGSAADVVDVYNTAKSGGYNTTAGGQQPGSRALGQELDVGIRPSVPVGNARIDMVAEGGVLLPGDAFDGLGGADGPGVITAARIVAGVAW